MEKEDENGQKINYLLTEGSGLEKTLGSLALRVVLSRISSLPKPNLLVLDEVFGKVANDNLENVCNLVSKISEYFDNLFVISHNPLIRDWGTNIITINKTNNISNISK